MGTVIHAQSKGTIAFVLRMDTVVVDPVTGEWPDMTWIHFLEDAGYDVIKLDTLFLAEDPTSQETLDTLNNADLVIIGRSVPTVTLGSTYPADKAAWNGITKPLLTGNMWALRSTRLNWFNTTAITTQGDSSSVFNATIEIPADPAFKDLTTTSGPIPWLIGSVDMLDTEDAGNGFVLAKTENVPSRVLFVRFDPYEEFFPGAGEWPEGYRSYLGNGRDASSLPPFNYFPFTEESKTVLLAEVANLIALGGGTSVGGRGNATTPSTFVLSQNYPNPFNPTTKIAYAVPAATKVLLEVFDVLGRKVATLVDETKQVGEYSVDFDASSLVSGVYMCRMTTPNTSIMKKMTLVR